MNRAYLRRQERSRERVKQAIAGWASLAGATTQDFTWTVFAPNRDGVQLAIIVNVTTEPFDIEKEMP